MVNVVAASSVWRSDLTERVKKRTGGDFVFITEKRDLTVDYLTSLKPRYVFFTHWSYLVPPEIFENFECIIFHMTDVPFGRGGSPLQNLISRGIYETKMTALRCEAEVDAGSVYLKRPFHLDGAAQEIYLRATDLIEEMMVEIIQNEPQPAPQQGAVVAFERRKPEQSDICALDSLQKVYDFIRMLDAEGYPKAFLETEHFRLEFERATLKEDRVVADVKIIRKLDHE